MNLSYIKTYVKLIFSSAQSGTGLVWYTYEIQAKVENVKFIDY